MENATKALLIAAAVLIAILIISLGLVVYNSSAETVKQANLSQQEVQAANEKYTRYNGEHKRGSEVNALLNTALSANLDAQAANEGEKQITVTVDGTDAVVPDTQSINAAGRADTSDLYTITVNYGGQGGLVDQITVAHE